MAVAVLTPKQLGVVKQVAALYLEEPEGTRVSIAAYQFISVLAPALLDMLDEKKGEGS